MVLMICGETDLIEYLSRSFSRPESQVYFHIGLYTIHWYMKCFPTLLHHVASQGWSQCCYQIVMVLNHFKSHVQGQKCPIWTFVIHFGHISQKQCMIWPMFFMKTHIQSHYMILSLLPHLWHWMTFKCQIKVTELSCGLILLSEIELLWEIYKKWQLLLWLTGTAR